jgi:hypothetical protein
MFGILAATTLISWLSLKGRKRVFVDVTTIMAGALLLATLFTLFISGLDRVHYLTFLIYPFLFFISVLHRQSHGLNRLLPVLILPQLLLFSWEAFRTPLVTFWIPKNQQNALGYSSPEIPQLSQVREYFGNSNVSISVWGWGARLLPALNGYQGNRDTVSVYLLPGVPEVTRRYHVAGFIEDILLRRPELVVDTSAYNVLPLMRTVPLKSCIELYGVVIENYVKWKSIDGAEFYLRRDLSSAPEKVSPHF